MIIETKIISISGRNQRDKYSHNRSRTINSLVQESCNKEMPEEAGAVPMREFSRVCERTIILPAGFLRFQAGTSWVGNQGGQSQEFLGARECLAHIAAHRVAPPARKPSSRGRSPRLARTLLLSCRGKKLDISVWYRRLLTVILS